MKIPIYQVDAFTNHLFGGNPAAVCILEKWLPEELLQNIAAENNLPATAFLVHESNNKYSIRWFGIEKEIPLCGHGTMAASYVIFNHLRTNLSQIIFNYPAGTLISYKNDNGITFDFPALSVQECASPEILKQGLEAIPQACFINNQTYLAVLDSEQQIRNLNVNISALQKLNCRNVIVTAKGDKVDFVSRNFYLGQSFFEDPVTGSAHCILVPYWNKQLNKNNLHALQVSQRGGELFCELRDAEVLLTGQAKLFMQGEICL
jgi:PhzF family phenazine biosynthesis protein